MSTQRRSKSCCVEEKVIKVRKRLFYEALISIQADWEEQAYLLIDIFS